MDRVLSEISMAVHGDEEHQADLELQRINSHHNFTQQERHFGEDVWVTRKGAIKATRESWAMIPGSMGTRSYIVVGKENAASFNSAPHGAGRRYSRTKARSLFTMDDLSRAMAGIEYRHAKVLLDEIPGAYKDIDQVIENARDLVEVKYRAEAVRQRQGRLSAEPLLLATAHVATVSTASRGRWNCRPSSCSQR